MHQIIVGLNVPKNIPVKIAEIEFGDLNAS